MGVMVLFFSAALTARAQNGDQTPGTNLLTSVEEVRSMTAEAARLGMAARIQGIVILVRRNNCLFLQQDGEGIKVSMAQDADLPQIGQWIEVQGETALDVMTPCLQQGRVLRSKPASIKPDARAVTFDELMTGREDAQYVQLKGVIHTGTAETNRTRFIIGSGFGRLLVEIPEILDAVTLEKLADSTVVLQGVCENVYNIRNRLRGLRLLLPDLSCLTVLEPAPTQVAAIPLRKIESLMRFAPDARPTHRVRVQGVITWLQPGRVAYVQDETGGVIVRMLDNFPALPGDRADVLGHVAMGDSSPCLQDGVFRNIRADVLPIPRTATAAGVLTRKRNAELVKIQGLLVNQIHRAGEWILFLQESNLVFTAHLDQGRISRSPWRAGSLLELTGICLLGSAEAGRVETLRILLRSPEDVRILKAAPWWDLKRTLTLLGILLAVALAAVLWTVTLRIQTQRQAAIIRSTLERENALRQRYRILFDQAGDLVFTLDSGGRILSFNKSGELLLGCSQSEALQTGFARWVAPADAPKFEAWMKCVPQGIEPGPLEIEVVAKDGHTLVLDCSPRLRRTDGRPDGIQVIARDITENRRAQVEMDRATRKLEAIHMELTVVGQQLARNRQALEMEIREHMRAGMELERIHKEWLVVSRQAGMAELAAGVLHDIGSVLDGISNSSTLLMNLLRHSDPSGLPKLAGQFRDVAVRMEQGGACAGELPPLLRQLEELAGRLVAEQNKLVRECATLRANVEHANGVIATQQGHARNSNVLERVSIAILIEDAAALCRPAFVRSHVDLVHDFGALPEMETDRTKVLQILVRLLRNAVVACEQHDHASHQVTVTAMPEKDSWIVITISDTGIGIPPENLDRIFAQRGANPASRFHGLHGSALAAQSLGGSITASSHGTGRGASFELRLPLRLQNKNRGKEGGTDV